MTSLITIDDWEGAAREKLPRSAYEYFSSGADEQITLSANRSAFAKCVLWPRILVDVSGVDVSTTVCGTRVSAPILVAPTAYQKLAHPDGEIASASGASQAGVIYTLSTLSNSTIEDVARASNGAKWFQLYVHKDRGLTKSLVERAEAAGYAGLVLTVDAPVLGRRLADERNNFALPEGLTMVNLGEAADDVSESEGGSALASFAASRHDPTLVWSDLDWLRSLSSMKLLVKGVLRPDDAQRAVSHGVDAIIVSNHGGRQLDSAAATIDALPRISDAVSGSCEVLMDGGVRRGTDVLKAIALGARAVLVGRPVIWGLAVGGSAGVSSVLGILKEELVRAMMLAGCSDLASVDRSLVQSTRSGSRND